MNKDSKKENKEQSVPSVPTEVEVQHLIIPDSYVRVYLKHKENFFAVLDPEGSYFKEGDMYAAFGESTVFYYKEGDYE
jgi:hypothetical protein